MAGNKRKKRESNTSEITFALHHIRLADVNRGKLAALDRVWDVYKLLCEQYIRLFCTEIAPDAALEFCFESALSARWQRDAVRQAAGVATSWHTNREQRYAAYADKLAWYKALSVEEQHKRKKPDWKEPNIPELHAISIQASKNVVE